MTILVTGCAGFIGSNFVHAWLQARDETVVNLDKLTYAGNLQSLASLAGDARHVFVKGDIGDRALVERLLAAHAPRAIVNFAAETHVDRSIHAADDFIQTNVVGTFQLLEAARGYWDALPTPQRDAFRFVHISTDEVYGTLEADEPAFTEQSRVMPNSPYAASKAAGNHFMRAWHRTYGFPALVIASSNNFGPRQFPEKLIPLLIHNALAGEVLPVYGDGLHVRDWLYVDDHCKAIVAVLESGRPGETYNVGGTTERQNIGVVRGVCALLDRLRPLPGNRFYADLIRFVRDRPGHDRRYAIDARKIADELNWAPLESFESGLEKTVRWYLANPDWVESINRGSYRQWVDRHYAAVDLRG